MRKILLFALFLNAASGEVSAQTPLVNGDFENWINQTDIVRFCNDPEAERSTVADAPLCGSA